MCQQQKHDNPFRLADIRSDSLEPDETFQLIETRRNSILTALPVDIDCSRVEDKRITRQVDWSASYCGIRGGFSAFRTASYFAPTFADKNLATFLAVSMIEYIHQPVNVPPIKLSNTPNSSVNFCLYSTRHWMSPNWFLSFGSIEIAGQATYRVAILPNSDALAWARLVDGFRWSLIEWNLALKWHWTWWLRKQSRTRSHRSCARIRRIFGAVVPSVASRTHPVANQWRSTWSRPVQFGNIAIVRVRRNSLDWTSYA